MSQPTGAASSIMPASMRPLHLQIASFAKKLWERWKTIAHKIGNFQARLLLMVFYIFILGPFALIIRWRGDPLGIKRRAQGGWLPHSEREGEPMERAKQQF
jgi:hypothetical protein